MTQTEDVRSSRPGVTGAANALTARWAATVPGDGTPAVLSGAGEWPLLGLLLGADGAGRDSLAQAFGLAEASAAAAARQLTGLFDRAPGMRAALGLWHRAHATANPAWSDQVPPATKGTLTGDPATDTAAVDRWTANRPAG